MRILRGVFKSRVLRGGGGITLKVGSIEEENPEESHILFKFFWVIGSKNLSYSLTVPHDIVSSEMLKIIRLTLSISL